MAADKGFTIRGQSSEFGHETFHRMYESVRERTLLTATRLSEQLLGALETIDGSALDDATKLERKAQAITTVLECAGVEALVFFERIASPLASADGVGFIFDSVDDFVGRIPEGEGLAGEYDVSIGDWVTRFSVESGHIPIDESRGLTN